MSRDIPEMTRLKPGDKLASGQKIADGLLINLTNADGDALDGNQYTGSVQIVPRDVLQRPEFTGVNWVLEASPKGTWRLLNQGDLDCGLSGRGGVPRLGSLSTDVTQADPLGNWLIYSYGKTGQIMLRPMKGDWLKTQATEGETGEIALGRCASGDETSALWRLRVV